MAKDLTLPSWADVGKTVWIRPHTYGPVSVYHKATVSRVTKTSVFVKPERFNSERRFVPMQGSWFGKETVMEEYGSRTQAWARPAYLFAADSETVKSGLQKGIAHEAFLKAVESVTQFSKSNTTDARRAAARDSMAALLAYLDSSEGL